MRNVPYILALLLLVNCNHAYIFTQDSLERFPCETADTGVNVRIKNVGKIAFSKISFRVNRIDYSYGGLKVGQTSCYKNLPYIWTHNFHSVWYYTAEHEGLIIQAQPVDNIGEAKIDSGFATVYISTKGSIHNPHSLEMKVIKDTLTH